MIQPHGLWPSEGVSRDGCARSSAYLKDSMWRSFGGGSKKLSSAGKEAEILYSVIIYSARQLDLSIREGGVYTNRSGKTVDIVL